MDRCAEEEEELAALKKQIEETRQARLEVHEEVRQLVREVKAMKYNPPQIVRRSIEAVYTVLQCQKWASKPVKELAGMEVDKEWPTIQRALSSDDFVERVLSFEVSMLDHAPHVAEFVVRKYFPQLLELLDELNPPSNDATPTSSAAVDLEGTSPFAAAMKASPQEKGSPADIDSPKPALNKTYNLSLAELTRAGTLPAYMQQTKGSGSKARKGSALSTSTPSKDPEFSSPQRASQARMSVQLQPGLPAVQLTAAQHEAMQLPSQQTAPSTSAPSKEPSKGLRRSMTVATDLRLPPATSTWERSGHKEPGSPGSPGGLIGKRSRSTTGLTRSTTGKLDSNMKVNSPQIDGRPSSASRLQSSTPQSNKPLRCLPQDVAANPLDLTAVVYASQACGVFVRWAIEVLREFLLTSGLQIINDRREACEDASLITAVNPLGQGRGDGTHEQSENQTQQHLEEWRTQPSGLPVRRPSDLGNAGNELVTTAAAQGRPMTDTPIMSKLGKSSEKRARFAASAKCSLFGRVGSPPLKRGPRWGITGEEGDLPPETKNATSPIGQSSSKPRTRSINNKESVPLASGEASSKGSVQVSPSSCNKVEEPPSPGLSALQKLLRDTELRVKADQEAKARKAREVSDALATSAVEQSPSTAFGLAAAGISKLVNAEQSPSLASTTHSSNSNSSTSISAEQASSQPTSAAGMPQVSSSGESFSSRAASTTKVSGTEQMSESLSSAAKAKALSNAEQLSQLAPTASAKATGVAERPAKSTTAPDSTEPSTPIRVERRMPKWATDFSDLCFIGDEVKAMK